MFTICYLYTTANDTAVLLCSYATDILLLMILAILMCRYVATSLIYY
jgi:hypothetical protein